ncbi:iron uptake system protein EfeO [Pseudonocardia hispaniensis]|uniref:Iron uptake system protein EfeO n=1 Tax=Pseudonocardia hispaniensis TaxID=904933 RepID=A0ABW1IZB4_9PSEU
MSRSRIPAILLTAGAVGLLTGCAGTTGPAPADPAAVGPVTVTAHDTACDLSRTQAPAGTISFAITNSGSQATEFYLFGAGDRVIGEAANIGPGLTRSLTVEVPDGGAYTTACKPGMTGEGIRVPFTVTGSTARSTDTDARLAEATGSYHRYVTAQVEALVTKAGEFAAAVKVGDVESAKALFPVARTHWERIEPVAESFGDLDPRIDGREDDEREPGVRWTGYHRLEKDLWVTGLQPDSGTIADQLVADIHDLQTRVASVRLTPLQLANGAKELLDEVATGKITGEEDRYSHTDLWDFQANVEGSQAAIAALRPVLDAKDPQLGAALDQRLAAVEALLATHRSGDGFQPYTALAPEDVKRLSDALDALAEPVSQVAGVITA